MCILRRTSPTPREILRILRSDVYSSHEGGSVACCSASVTTRSWGTVRQLQFSPSPGNEVLRILRRCDNDPRKRNTALGSLRQLWRCPETWGQVLRILWGKGPLNGSGKPFGNRPDLFLTCRCKSFPCRSVPPADSSLLTPTDSAVPAGLPWSRW